VWADGVGDDDVVVNHKQDAMAVREMKVENLMTMPKDAFEFMDV
jgi:hypothetical protein